MAQYISYATRRPVYIAEYLTYAPPPEAASERSSEGPSSPDETPRGDGPDEDGVESPYEHEAPEPDVGFISTMSAVRALAFAGTIR